MSASTLLKILSGLLVVSGLAFSVGHLLPAAAADQGAPSHAKPHLDRSGRKRVGTASFYAEKFAGRTMADGTPMHPEGDNAASKTLPLGTRARVTDLETGRSAVITIRDRGPFVDGRIVDLSPSTAQKIGIDRKQGLAQVEIMPLEMPSADGPVKYGVGGGETAKRKRAAGGWGN